VMSWQRSCRRDAVAAGAGDRTRVLGGGGFYWKARWAGCGPAGSWAFGPIILR
jgi:hypothetical protein